MSEENKTLNKGLEALLGQSDSNQRSVKDIEVSKIKPGRFQPRSNFDKDKLADRLKREFGLTQDEVASSTGKARSTIANSLRILSLPTLVLDMLSSGKIEKGHAKLLASMQPNKAEEVAKKIIKEGLTVRDLSNLSLKSKSKQNSRLKQKDTDVLNIEKEMSEIFGHKIEIEAKNTKTGKVSIIYKTLDELDNIISKIKNK